MTPLRRRWLIGRRAVLRGAAGAAVALPWLEAHAAAAPRRFLVWFTPGGTVMEAWRPTGTESDFTLPYLLEPLAPWRQHLLFLNGLDMKVTADSPGSAHSKGMSALLTGHPLLAGSFHTDESGNPTGFSAGPSVDQIIAAKIGGGRKFKSLELGVRWATWAYTGGKASPTNIINLQEANQPIPPATDPQAVWTRLFADVGTNEAQLLRERAQDRSILDGVKRRYTALIGRLGVADRRKLEAHLDKIRELELSLASATRPAAAGCGKPDIGAPFDHTTDAAVPRAGKLMMDMLVMALRCDLTSVATMMWVDSASFIKFPWLNLTDKIHHGYQHAGDWEILKKIYRWFNEQLAYFLGQISDPATREGDRTILDSTLMFWGTEIQRPSTHAYSDMPFVLSSGGALRGGRWLRYASLPHNNLHVSLLNAFGVETQTFGKPKFCTGPLAGLV
jgi:hypothetical protein